MTIRLNKLIEEENLAWSSSTIRPKDFIHNLSSHTLRELKSESLPKIIGDISQVLRNFPYLQKEMSKFYTSNLKNGVGFGVIKGLNNSKLSSNQKEIVYWMAASVLGTLLEQNAQGDIRYEVRDKGKKMEEGGRYSESRQAGVLHTDAIQWDNSPEIIGLLCLHPAMSGGESVVMSAYSLHNRLLKDNPHLLEVMYSPFPFETRKSGGEVSTIQKPIFQYSPKTGLRFEYIGTYVPLDSLTNEQKKAKELLDKTLEDKTLAVDIGKLEAEEMLFFMNHRLAHGRGSEFVNYPEPEKERIMVRAWLRDKNGN